MKTSKILVTGVSITEDEYDYRGQFIITCENLGCEKKSMTFDLASFQSDPETVRKAKNYFNFEEDIKEIQKEILKKVIEKVSLLSKNIQGENYSLEGDHS